MKFFKLTSVAAALTLAAALGSMPAFADDDERNQCSIVSTFIYESTEFDSPVIDVYGSGFGKKDRDPKVQLAGVDVGYFIVESSDTRLVIALDPNSTAVQDLFQAIPGPTSDQADFAPYSSFHLQLLIKPRGRKQTACAPITISAGYPASTGEIPETSTEPVGDTLLRSYVGSYAPVISLR
jgi:hypothetical protein